MPLMEFWIIPREDFQLKLEAPLSFVEARPKRNRQAKT